MNYNDRGLPILNEVIATAIFDCVYGIENVSSETTKLLKDENFKLFIMALNAQQEFNYHVRAEQACELYTIFEETVGPMESNSDGPIIWMALGLAIKELYGMRRSTLKEVMKMVEIRK
ncbi:hypothetical protein [Viridibacillus arvi]|uniref:hypothetical protein n=1 Tax=Viridibacillus arvi TaxID=263475 RepID=UPI0034CF3B16